MKRSTIFGFLRLVLVTAALCWGVSQASGQMTMQTGGRRPQTGPYRSVQTILQMRQTTKAQRLAAAQRNAERKAAAGQKNQVGGNAYREVKK